MARMVLDGEWRDSVINGIGEVAVMALGDNAGDVALTQKIWRARSLATEFANLLCDRPALSAVPVESWTVPHYQHLFNDVSTIEREFRLLGDLDSMTHPAYLAFHFLSQRLQDLLYYATNPSPNATGNTTPEAPKSSTDAKPKKATINARMIDALFKRPEAKDWTITQWQQHLDGKPGRATIHGTNTWRELEKMRTDTKMARLERDSFRGDHGKRKPNVS